MTDFGKGIVCAILGVLMIVGAIIAVVSISKTTFDENDYTVKTIYVNEGDSLYKYYYRYADTEKTSVEDYCQALKELNNMKSSMIYAYTSFKVYVAIGD